MNSRNSSRKDIKILKYPWHTGHDYELLKLPYSFLLLQNTYRTWERSYRPFPSSEQQSPVQWVRSVEEAQADLMILHLDQWSFHELSKRFLFLHLKRAFPGPKVVIIHGCNMVDGCSREQMQSLTEGCSVVCNSATALKLWDLPGSRCIVHGFHPEEWPTTDLSRNNILVVQPHRSRWQQTTNVEGIRYVEEKVQIDWIGRDRTFSTFAEYQQYLGSSSIFFNPSYSSTNPRARAEAMLCGLAVVTTGMHGEEKYIENGRNGFVSNDFDELREFLLELKNDPIRTREIGRRGQQTARELFSHGQFAAAWNDLLFEEMKLAA